MVVEKMMKDIFRIEVPLSGNPLKYTNAYLIVGTERHLLVDTGFKREECRNTIERAFFRLGISLKDTDLFITHLHADHSGLAGDLVEEGRKVYCSRQDGEMINGFSDQTYWSEMTALFAAHGMPLPEEDERPGNPPGQMFQNQKKIKFTFLEEGDRLSVGAYCLTCILTPGHSPGHLCLYDEKEKIFFSGDHILGDISPVISLEKGLEDPLFHYLKSLEKVENMEIETILTGHRRKVEDVYHRIKELKIHHENRLVEVKDILKKQNKPMNAYEVAAFMSWRSTCGRWEDYPRQQRWFATGEAAAHLVYLFGLGEVTENRINGKYVFSLT